jgi:hypothetical protein
MLSALWGLLAILTLVTLFVTYANFPDYFSLNFMGLDTDMQLDRHNFFYIFAGLFLIVNLITYAGLRTMNSLNSAYRLANPQHYLKISVAIKILVVGANLFLLILMAYSRAAIEAQSLTGVIHWLILFIGPVIMLSGLGYFLFVLLKPVRSDQ